MSWQVSLWHSGCHTAKKIDSWHQWEKHMPVKCLKRMVCCYFCQLHRGQHIDNIQSLPRAPPQNLSTQERSPWRKVRQSFLALRNTFGWRSIMPKSPPFFDLWNHLSMPMDASPYFCGLLVQDYMCLLHPPASFLGCKVASNAFKGRLCTPPGQPSHFTSHNHLLPVELQILLAHQLPTIQHLPSVVFLEPCRTCCSKMRLIYSIDMKKPWKLCNLTEQVELHCKWSMNCLFGDISRLLCTWSKDFRTTGLLIFVPATLDRDKDSKW